MSLHGTYDDSNVFAKILRGEAASVAVFEDASALAFLDVFPQSEGHTLVIPKAPARTFLELPRAAVGLYMESVHRVAQAVERAFRPDGLVLTQFNGAPAGQSVFHAHFHIIPRYAGAALQGHGQAGPADPERLKAHAAAIIAALSQD